MIELNRIYNMDCMEGMKQCFSRLCSNKGTSNDEYRSD